MNQTIEQLQAKIAELEEELLKTKLDLLTSYGESEELLGRIAEAEQRVAEACALAYLEDYDLTDIAERVRAGEYRKFMKGEQ